MLAVLVGPIPAAAQPRGKTARLGFLGNQSPTLLAPMVDAFRQGLRDPGWVEGQNMSIEYRGDHRTTRALGLTIPPSLMLRADQVIE